MKKLIFLTTTLFLFFSACKKDQGQQQQITKAAPTLSLDVVKSAFPDLKLPVDWAKAQSFAGKKNNYWLVALPGQPTWQGIKQGYRKIAFARDSTGKLTARILEIIPDAQYFQRKGRVTTQDFTGRIFFYDLDYNLLGGKIFAGGKQVGAIRPKPPGSGKLQTAMVAAYTDCDWYDSSHIDGEGVFTIHSEEICTTTIFDDGFEPDMDLSGGGGGDAGGDPIGGGGGSAAPAETPPQIPDLPAANNPAVNPKLYMNCFGNIPDAGATMTVTVYVQEPLPGTSFPYGTNGVGHTAVGLSKSGGGQTITQVVGFYPVSPGNALGGASKVVDNTNTPYNASITYSVNAAQFNAITNYIANPPSTYDLYNFNCTNFAISACAQAGITLPNADTIVGLNGVGGFAHSMTPGGLGDSLDSMKGQSNVNNNGGPMPASHGACN